MNVLNLRKSQPYKNVRFQQPSQAKEAIQAAKTNYQNQLKGKFIFLILIFPSLSIFDPNEIIDDNCIVAQMVKQNITLLQKCLKSSNKALYFAAIDSLINASNMYGPALNKHLPYLIPLV